ncbi:sugar transferase [Pedobacter sp. MC2016-15]|uniref:sugar transferase n=1 Tax=Pedobacter sp. MC2016-15 TaxID=2994473 RepID=UPI002246E948|nr:sugar transferase [Pedobacter sp. MC2016-15]MCX2481811.1 sugar transferase [Pedobacter sp. MC2016-15]
MYKYFLKRFIDFSIALIVIFLASPVILIVFLLLFIANDGKAFFVQARPGKNGKIFKILKFKTMNDKSDENGLLLPDAERLTKIGSFVRSTSLDELPQLFNVIIGDMSLIGPRPLLVEYLPLYNKIQMKRHDVRPGITGWAQVNGRNSLSWSEKFNLDVEYVNNLTFGLDLKIVLLTIKKVFIREGINSSTSSTMEKFKGN